MNKNGKSIASRKFTKFARSAAPRGAVTWVKLSISLTPSERSTLQRFANREGISMNAAVRGFVGGIKA